MIAAFGIYAWKNLVTGRLLVGQTGSTVGFAKRKARYLQELKADRWNNRHFQRSWNKYGGSSFSFIILERLNDNKALTENEQKFVNYYRSQPGGVYNFVGPVDNPRRGCTNSSNHRAKISAALKGKKRGPQSESHTAKISAANMGKKRSAQARANISAGKKGVKFSKEHLVNLTKANKAKWTPELRKKVSEIAVKRPVVGTDTSTGESTHFNSICEAERQGYIKGHIIKCLKGERKSHSGCIWKDA